MRHRLTVTIALGFLISTTTFAQRLVPKVGERVGPGEKDSVAQMPSQTKEGGSFSPSSLTTERERRYAARTGFEIAIASQPASQISGNWILEASTSDGLLQAKLTLEENGKKLSAALAIDNHLLKGEGETDGTQFEVLLTHADGSGPGHSKRLSLSGRLKGDRISGWFDNGTDQGSWTGRKNKVSP